MKQLLIALLALLLIKGFVSPEVKAERVTNINIDWRTVSQLK